VLYGGILNLPVTVTNTRKSKRVLPRERPKQANFTPADRTKFNSIEFGATDDSTLLTIDDGIPAPTAIAGKAKIYVDSATGDLKVIFGDGVIKTIVIDT
jgi:hypothetical protein